jgi:NHL repeat
MLHRSGARIAVGSAVLLLSLLWLERPAVPADPAAALPNPYHLVEHWASLPEGRSFGQVIGVKIDRDGKSVWAFERCGNRYCTKSNLAPVLEFAPSGALEKSFGAGLFVFPHGLFVDKDDNIWTTDGDGDAAAGKGHQVIEFSRDGKVLMMLGKAGVAGEGPDVFNKPTDVLVAPNGDIFVADGHGNSRIVKFSHDGKFIKAWGKHGSGPGEFATPHSLAMDAQGRLFVADRENNRVEIFDQDGNFVADWRQFGRPSGVFIDKNDLLYVTDAQSNDTQNPGFKRGIRIGSARDGKLIAFIPDLNPNTPQGTGPEANSGAESIAVDDQGNVYGAETGGKILRKFAKQ